MTVKESSLLEKRVHCVAVRLLSLSGVQWLLDCSLSLAFRSFRSVCNTSLCASCKRVWPGGKNRWYLTLSCTLHPSLQPAFDERFKCVSHVFLQIISWSLRVRVRVCVYVCVYVCVSVCVYDPNLCIFIITQVGSFGRGCRRAWLDEPLLDVSWSYSQCHNLGCFWQE